MPGSSQRISPSCVPPIRSRASLTAMTEACPCGSGRVLEHCCSEPLLDPELQYTSDDRDRALRKMETVRGRTTSRHLTQQAVEIFWEPLLPEDDDDARALLTNPNLQSVYSAFLYWDIGTWGKQPLGDLVLEEFGKRLSKGERAFLRAGLASYWGIYEILESRPGVGVLVQDLWRPRRLWIHERSASEQLVRYDLLGGRVIKRPQGQHEFEGDLLDFTFQRKAEFLAHVHELHKVEDEELPGVSDQEFFKVNLPDLAAWWVEEVATPRPLPEIRTPEGDEWRMYRARFKVREREGLVRTLDLATDLARSTPDDFEWSWIEPSGSGDRILARIELGEQELVVEATSTQRMARARDYLTKIAEGHLAHVETTEDSLAELMQKHPRPAPRDAGLPPEITREFVLQKMDEHYRGWLDERIPALDGWTPRRAAREPKMRARVVELLKGIENLEAGKRRTGGVAYDSGWMWKELGLDRPGG